MRVRLGGEAGAMILGGLRTLDRDQRAAFTASLLGWALDAFDFFILVFVVEAISKDFHVRVSAVSLGIALTLMMRPLGAVVFGWLADRFGRRPVLMADVLLFTGFELASAFAPNLATLLVLRAGFGFAMGGEWGIGASLALESIPAKSRGVVSGLLQEGYALGYLLAALANLFVDRIGWRGMFVVGALPALLTLYIRSHVKESPAFEALRARARAARAARVPPATLAAPERGRAVSAHAVSLAAAGVVALALPLIAAGGRAAPAVWAMAAAAAAALAAGVLAATRGLPRVPNGAKTHHVQALATFWLGLSAGVIAALVVASTAKPVRELGGSSALLAQVFGAALIAWFLARGLGGVAIALRGRALRPAEPESFAGSLLTAWPRLLYAVVLMTAFNLFSHGTQDLYPTFLKVQHHFPPALVTTLAVVANLGAILGGLTFGALSERIGRRRAIATAALIALPVIPLWAFSATPLWLGLGAFLLQISVQGAWGVVPVHLNELAPDRARGVFPGVAYQLGNLIASGNAVVQAGIAESRHDDYGYALALVAGIVAVVLAGLALFGPERKGVAFGGAVAVSS